MSEAVGAAGSPANAFEQILVVQGLDTTIDQLHHRIGHLPERARLDEVNAELAALERARTSAAAQRDELASAQARLEAEITAVTDKAAQVDRQLYSGTVTVPRELQAMQDEMGALGRRQRVLEDHVLELMEQLEPVDAELGSLDEQRVALDAEAVHLIAAIAEAEATISAEIEHLSSARAGSVEGLPAALVTEYETLRSRLGGIGAARLVGSSCTGCHLTLPAVEIDRIRHLPADALVHCDECGRLLVRAS